MNIKTFLNSLSTEEKEEIFIELKNEFFDLEYNDLRLSIFIDKYEKELYSRTINILKDPFIQYYGDLLVSNIKKSDFMKIRNSGMKSWLNFEEVRRLHCKIK